jgi:DNA-binding XRE family transcriptional regulator
MENPKHLQRENKLRIVRQAQDLALYGVAARAGVSPTTLCAIEKWGYCPTAGVRQRIAAALGVTEREIWPELG